MISSLGREPKHPLLRELAAYLEARHVSFERRIQPGPPSQEYLTLAGVLSHRPSTLIGAIVHLERLLLFAPGVFRIPSDEEALAILSDPQARHAYARSSLAVLGHDQALAGFAAGTLARSSDETRSLGFSPDELLASYGVRKLNQLSLIAGLNYAASGGARLGVDPRDGEVRAEVLVTPGRDGLDPIVLTAAMVDLDEMVSALQRAVVATFTASWQAIRDSARRTAEAS